MIGESFLILNPFPMIIKELYTNRILYNRSPITHVNTLKNPTLIIAGENNPILPLQPIRELYAGLNLPAMLGILKGEGHLPDRTFNVIRMAVREL
jgi:dipeptidyl aminopeptidase/acylaminoacyl peptidase